MPEMPCRISDGPQTPEDVPDYVETVPGDAWRCSVCGKLLGPIEDCDCEEEK